MSLDRLSISFSSSERQLVKSREDPSSDVADFSFSSGEMKSYFFDFFATSEEVGKQLALKELKLRILGKNGGQVDHGYPAVVDFAWNLEAEGSAAGIAAEQQAFQVWY
jgi:hypothetical protein